MLNDDKDISQKDVNANATESVICGYATRSHEEINRTSELTIG